MVSLCRMLFTIGYNVRVYEPLRDQGALWSSYHRVTKRADLRKPSASNGLYTLLPAGLFFVILNYQCLLDLSFYHLLFVHNKDKQPKVFPTG